MAESVIEHLASSVSENWTRYRVSLMKCQTKPQTEAVHDLRTSIRRLTPALRLSEELLPKQKKKIAKIRKSLKQELHLMRELRDYQVQNKVLKGDRKLKGVLKFVRKETASEKKRVRSRLKPVESKTKKRLLCVQYELVEHESTQHDLAVSFRFLEGLYRKLLESAKKANIEDAYSIHRVRIEFKKFRYAREILAPALRGGPMLDASLGRFQKILGDIQDHEAMIQTATAQGATRLAVQEALIKTQLMEELLKNLESKIREFKPVRKLQR